MIDFSDPVAGVSRRFARAMPYRPHWLDLPVPVVSFTFDDFPQSAADNAAPLLEAAGARGTFYYADKLAGRDENGQRIADHTVAARLAEAGHEIGGHTSGHLNVQRTAPDHLIADVTANETAIATLSGRAPASFAYPFGVVSARSKHILASRYASLRGIQPGINRGWIDRAHLAAQELYDKTLPLSLLDRLLDDLIDGGGWLVFYTHDVSGDPSSIGCSTAHFARVVERVRQRQLAIWTVGNVLDWQGRVAP